MRTSRIILPLAVLGFSVAIALLAIANKTKPQRREPTATVTAVDVIRAVKQDYPVIIHTRGTVQPRTESVLIPEVSGRVIAISPSFRDGGFFERDELLLQIDPRDYQAAEKSAASALAQARLLLEEEQARARQAKIDWKRMGEGGAPGDLVLRKPQLAAARAALVSAEAQLAQARLNLQRTKITAPYAGRVLKQNVDVGQYVTPSKELANIYAVDYVEVRLPLTNRQLEYVEIPELYRGQVAGQVQSGPTVILRGRYGMKDYEWQGTVVRAEGAIDLESRQSFVIAQVSDPYSKVSPNKPPLKVGQFVEAEIHGKRLQDVYVIPRTIVIEGGAVMVVNDAQRLERHVVSIVWSDDESAVIESGLEEGELLALTPLGRGMGGMPVKANMVDTPSPVPAPARSISVTPSGDRP